MPKQEPQQSQYAPQPDPNAQYGPAPQPQNTPYEQQPVNQQFKSSGESYVGIKDWLRTFVILFALQAASDIYIHYFRHLPIQLGYGKLLALFGILFRV